MCSMHLLKYFKLANRENFSATLYVRNTLRPKDSKGNNWRKGWNRAGWRHDRCSQLPGFSASPGAAHHSPPDAPVPAAALLSLRAWVLVSRTPTSSPVLPPRGCVCFQSYDRWWLTDHFSTFLIWFSLFLKLHFQPQNKQKAQDEIK